MHPTPAAPDRSYSRSEYHRIRQRLHGAHIEDDLADAAHRRDEVYADRRSTLTARGFNAVQATLSGLPHELVWLLEVSRKEPSPAGRLVDIGPRSKLLRLELAQRMVKRRRALVVAEMWAQSQAVSERVNAARYAAKAAA